jgi:hypothetical protein
MAPGVQVVFDCADPAALAKFWSKALGYEMEPPPEGFSSWEEWAVEQGIPEERWNDANAAVDPAGLRPRLFFQKVPEPKKTKNRLHLDVKFTAGLDISPEEAKRMAQEEAHRLEGIGAKTVGPMSELGEFWIVMQDPEGNEFCVS